MRAGDVPKWSANCLTAWMEQRWVVGEKPRSCMSSNMRRRKGVMTAPPVPGRTSPAREARHVPIRGRGGAADCGGPLSEGNYLREALRSTADDERRAALGILLQRVRDCLL